MEKELSVDMAGNRKVFSTRNDDIARKILEDKLYEIDGIIEEIKEVIFEQGNDDEAINFYKNELLEANIERDIIINEINKL